LDYAAALINVNESTGNLVPCNGPPR